MALLTRAGTFDAATVVGNQAVVGVGFTPKALLIWGSGTTTDGAFNEHAFQGIGFSTSPTNQYAQSSAIATTADAATFRRVETCAFIQTNVSATAIVRRANLASMDTDGFTLNWTIASTGWRILGYLALGGDDLTGAKVVNWQTPTVIGNKAVIGVGFQPDCVLHVHAGGTTALDANATQAATLGLGVMTAAGGQWATGYVTNSTSAHARNQESDKTLTAINTVGTIVAQAAYASMDSDGFTTNFGVAAGGAWQVISLCLKGGQYNAGRIIKPTTAAPVSQAVPGVGFAPKGVLLAGVQDIVRAAPLASAGVAYGIGASDGTTEWGSALYGADTASRKNISKTTKAYVKVNTTGSVIDAEADLTSFDADGLTLNWTTNDAIATSIPYLAMGSNAVTATGLDLTPTTGNTSLAGQASTLTGGATLDATAGASTLAGEPASLTTGDAPAGLDLTASAGTVTAQGQAATFAGGMDLATTTAASTLAGQGATFAAGMALDPLTGNLSLAGLTSDFVVPVGLTLDAFAGAVFLDAPPAVFLSVYPVSIDAFDRSHNVRAVADPSIFKAHAPSVIFDAGET